MSKHDPFNLNACVNYSFPEYKENNMCVDMSILVSTYYYLLSIPLSLWLSSMFGGLQVIHLVEQWDSNRITSVSVIIIAHNNVQPLQLTFSIER